MNVRTPARLAAVIAAVAVLVAAAGWFLLVSAQHSEATRLQADVDTANTAYAAKRAGLDNRLGVAGVAPPKLLARALPAETHIADVMVALSTLGDASGVTFTSLTPGAPVAGAGFTVTPLETQFQGTWAEISAFVSKVRRQVTFTNGRLQAAGQLYSVRKIDLSEGTKKFPNLTAALTVDVFSSGPAAGAIPPVPTTPTAAPAAS
jgi:Tfp pilus assembly protein PilO